CPWLRHERQNSTNEWFREGYRQTFSPRNLGDLRDRRDSVRSIQWLGCIFGILRLGPAMDGSLGGVDSTNLGCLLIPDGFPGSRRDKGRIDDLAVRAWHFCVCSGEGGRYCQRTS